eukprot:Pgem_evm1s166
MTNINLPFLCKTTSIPIPNTCGDFFDVRGWGVCKKNQYDKRERPNKICHKGICNLPRCCYNIEVHQPKQTCQDFFNTYNTAIHNVCYYNNWLVCKDINTVCQTSSCQINECCDDYQGLPVQESCRLFFARHGTQSCTQNGLGNPKQLDVLCAGSHCQASECCDSQVVYGNTCRDYFKENGIYACPLNGFPSQKDPNT